MLDTKADTERTQMQYTERTQMQTQKEHKCKTQKEHKCKCIRPGGYKTFLMLNSAEHEIFPAHKY